MFVQTFFLRPDARRNGWLTRGPRRTRLVATAVLGLLTASLGFSGSAVALATPAVVATSSVASSAAAATDANPEVSVSVTPADSVILRPNEDLRLNVTIDNPTDSAVTNGIVDLYLANRALTSRTALSDWLESTGANTGEAILEDVAVGVVPARGSTSVIAIVPSAALGLESWNAWGARGVAATLRGDGDVLSKGRGTFVWFTADTALIDISDAADAAADADARLAEITPVNLSIVVPITVPGAAQGLIPATELESLTSATGLLSRQLASVENTSVTLALDPRILASIRVLGTAAPADAVAWLERLDRATNEIFALSYADADIALQSQAGLSTLLTPGSFEGSLDPALFPASTEIPANSSPAGTPQPTAPANLGVPSRDDLLAWDYTVTGLAWPAANTVVSADFPVFAANGLGTSVLASGNVEQDSRNLTPNAAVTLANDYQALAADGALTRALEAATDAESDAAWRAAIAELSSVLATVSAHETGPARTVLATLDRGWSPQAERLRQTLDTLNGLPWFAPASLQEALNAEPAATVSFAAGEQSRERLMTARTLLTRHDELAQYSTLISNPAVLTDPENLDLLALLGNSWRDQPTDWADAVNTHLGETSEILNSVSVTTKGPITVVGSQVDIPFTLNNDLGEAVTVQVRVEPSNGRLVVAGTVESVIDATSARSVLVPVTAAVGNGDVVLKVTLFSAAGVQIDQPALIPVNVRADWEGLGSLIFAAFVVAFFGFGVWRNISRRRRERSTLNVPGETLAPGVTRG